MAQHSGIAARVLADYVSARMILGHERQVRELRRLLETETLPSALCFEGPWGIGKATLARAFAAEALALTAAQQRAPLAEHPDVWHFQPSAERPRLKIADIREQLLPFLRQAPFVGKRACVLLEDADTYLGFDQPALANVLLKSLEEPRAGVHFLLTTSCPERLLDTVRSRTQSIAFAALPSSVLGPLAETHGWPPWTTALASGSPGLAQRLCEHGDAITDMVGATLTALLGRLPSLTLGERAAALESDHWLGACQLGARVALAWSQHQTSGAQAVAEALHSAAPGLVPLLDALRTRGGDGACRDLAEAWLNWEALADTTLNRRLRLAADLEALR